MTTISTRFGLSLLLSVGLAAPASAEMTAEAEGHFTAGSQAFEQKQYAAALEEFWLGYLLDPQPDFLYAMGQAYRAAGQCAKARAAYDAFKRAKPGKKKAAKADANMARCVDAPPAPPAAVAPTTPPPEDPPPTDPGPQVKPAEPPAALGGPPTTVTVDRGDAGPWYTDWLGDSLAVGGFVALGVGGFLFVGGRSDLAKANEPGRYVDYATFSRDVESASRKQTIGVVTFAAGGALMTAAVLRWWLRPGAGEPAVDATAGRDGGMVFYRARF